MIRPDNTLLLLDFTTAWEIPEVGYCEAGTNGEGYTPLNYAPERGANERWSYNSDVWELATWFSTMSSPERYYIFQKDFTFSACEVQDRIYDADVQAFMAICISDY